MHSFAQRRTAHSARPKPRLLLTAPPLLPLQVYDDVPLPPMILEPNLSLIPRFHGGGNLIEDSLHYERDLKKRVFWTDREKAIFFER